MLWVGSSARSRVALIQENAETTWKVYELTASGDISTLVATGRYFDTDRGNDIVAYGLREGKSGERLYIAIEYVGFTGFEQYELSTAWDIASRTYTGQWADDLGISTPYYPTLASGLCFSTDGTKAYCSNGNSNYIRQYALSTAWDITTASYVQYKDFPLTNYSLTEPAFKTDGTKLYLVYQGTTDRVRQYSLSTAWDISTATYDSVTFNVVSQTNTPNFIKFASNGLKFWLVGNSKLWEYSLSTAWDLSTASYSGNSFSPISQGINGTTAGFALEE